MFIATVVIAIVFALMLVFSGVGKLRHDPKQMGVMTEVGFPEDKVGLLALAEFAGAIGLILGLFWWPIGVAAAIGTFLYVLGAAIFHLRAGDKNIAPVVVLMLVSIAYIVLRVLSI